MLPSRCRDFDTPLGAVARAETIRRAFLDRHDRPFDPSFFSQDAGRRTNRAEYAQFVARRIATRMQSHGDPPSRSQIGTSEVPPHNVQTKNRSMSP